MNDDTATPSVYVGNEKIFIRTGPIAAVPLDGFVHDVTATGISTTLPADSGRLAAAASDRAIDAVGQIYGSPNPVMSLWHTLVDQLTESFLWKTGTGNLILAGGIAALVSYMVLRRHSTPAVTATQQIKIPVSNNSRARLKENLNLQAQTLRDLGANSQDVDLSYQQSFLTEGARLAIDGQSATPSPAIAPSHLAVHVQGRQSPAHYTGLGALDINQYLDTLSKPVTQTTMIENAAVMHELATKED